MRKFIIALVLLLAIVFVIGRFAEVENILHTIQRGQWAVLLLCLLVQAAWLLNVGAQYRAIFGVLGLDKSLIHMVRLSSAANFFNILAPSGGMGGLLVFISDARHHGYSSGRTTIAGALYVLSDYAGLLMVLPFGFLFLSQQNKLNWTEILAGLILILLGGGLAFLLYLGMHSEEQLARVLNWLARLVNRITRPFSHRHLVSEDRAASFAHDGAEGIRELRHSPKDLLKPLLLAASNKILMITVLTLVFWAFHVPATVGILVAAFSLAYLFLIVSPTPSGIGIVEGVMTISLHSLGVPLDDAAVITLVYRAFTFWIPFLFGMLTFRHLVRAHEINGTRF